MNDQIRDRRGRPRFGMVYRDDLLSPEVRGLSAAAFRLWIIFTTYVHQEADRGWAISSTRLAEDLGLVGKPENNKREVRLRIAALVDAGLLTVERHEGPNGGSGWNTYTLTSPLSQRGAGEMAPPGEGPQAPGGEGAADPPREGPADPPVYRPIEQTKEQIPPTPQRPPLQERASGPRAPTTSPTATAVPPPPRPMAEDIEAHLADVQIGPVLLPGDLSALLYGVQVGRRVASHALVAAGVRGTRDLLSKKPRGTASLVYEGGVGQTLIDRVDEHLWATYGIRLGCLYVPEPEATRPSRQASLAANLESLYDSTLQVIDQPPQITGK